VNVNKKIYFVEENKNRFLFEALNELATTRLSQSIVWLFQTILLFQNDIFKASFSWYF
jgi:hypothetical protein